MKHRRSVPCALMLVLLELGSLTAQPTTYHVSQAGSDANSCAAAQSPAGAKGTINAGIACMAGGDTLLIGGGTYINQCIADTAFYETVPVPPGTSWSNPTTIRNTPGETVWLKGENPHPLNCPQQLNPVGMINFDVERNAFTIIDGINVDGNNVARRIVSVNDTKFVRFQNATWQRSRGDCVAVAGRQNPTNLSGTDNEWRNLHLLDCGLSPLFPTTQGGPGAHGVYHFAWNNVWDHVTITNANCNGIQFTTEGGRVSGNTFQHGCITGAGCTGIVSFPTNTISHNILRNNSIGIDAYTSRIVNNVVTENKVMGISLKGRGHEVTDNRVVANTECDICDGGGFGGATFANNGCGSVGGENVGCTHTITLSELGDLTCPVTGGTTLSVSPTTVAPGGTITATWSGIATPSATDWLGLYTPGAANTAYLDWIYVSCSQSAGAARASGACPFVVPSTVAPGTYQLQLRLLANDGFTEVLATSNNFTVQ